MPQQTPARTNSSIHTLCILVHILCGTCTARTAVRCLHEIVVAGIYLVRSYTAALMKLTMIVLAGPRLAALMPPFWLVFQS